MHLLPIEYNYSCDKFLLRIEKTFFALVQDVFFQAEGFLDKSEMQIIAGVRFEEIMNFRNEHLLDLTSELILSSKEVHTFISVLDPMIYTIADLDELLTSKQVILRKEVVSEIGQLRKTIRFFD